MGNIFDVLLNRPLGALMYILYELFNNYAAAIFFFALIVQVLLLPLGIKQQKNQISMAKIRPKEQAIRGKYAGRTDTANQQKMNAEIMAMHKAENYSQLSGCLPMLVQLPIIFALFNIVRNPLTFISRLAPEVTDSVKTFIVENKELFIKGVTNTATGPENVYYIKGLGTMTVENIKSIQQINIVEIFNVPELFAAIQNNVPELADFVNVNYGFLGQMLTSSPAAAGFSVLLLIPLLNLATSLLRMKLQKIINGKTMAANVAENKSMKFMEYTMPLLIVWMAYTWESALGLYWVFRSVVELGQMLVFSRIFPLPVITEEEYELARKQYGSVAKKKKKKKKPAEIDGPESDEDNDNEETGDGDDDSEDDGEKYLSKTIPQGINPAVKNNYQKTGKKYKINKRKK